MERRKVFRVRQSYAVYLPKQWCVSRGITDGNEVALSWDGDVLVLRPPRDTRIEIVLDEPSESHAVRLIVSAYVTGHDMIELKVRGMPLDFRHSVQVFARGLQMFIVEEGPDTIVFRVHDVKIDKMKLFSRMFNVLMFMLDYAVKAPKLDSSFLDSIDDEVDRYRLMIERMCYKYPNERCIHHVQLARHIERAADHVVELARMGPQTDVFVTLLGCAHGFSESVFTNNVAEILGFFDEAARCRTSLAQHALSDVELLHAHRVIDYLANAAEVFLDMNVAEKDSVRVVQEDLNKRTV